MNTIRVSFGIACGAVLLAMVTAGNVRAQSSEAMEAIRYPVAELGNCDSREACKTYCDEPGNLEACISFAEKNSLMPEEEIQTARKFIAAGAKGPGGCTGKESCEAYCNDIDHIDACVSYAEQNGLMSGDELVEAKKVQAAVRSGVKPPACRGKRECDAYCESPDHMPECIAFAKAAGLMSEEEQADAEKMLQAIKNGAKPPACRGKKECDAYCAEESHFDECVEFGRAAGFMSEEEAMMAKKTRGKGPGGCRGKEECDALCSSSQENEELCLNFAQENGLLSESRLKDMEEDGNRFRQSFANMPPEVESCLSNAWGADNFEKLKSGAKRPSRWIGDAMSTCFAQFEKERMQNEKPSGPPPGSEQGRYDGPRPEGVFPCEGENCRPPEGMYPPCEGDNCRPPEGFMLPPEGKYGPPPSEGNYPPPPSSYGPPPEGMYPPCEGDNCRPPEGSFPPPCEGDGCRPSAEFRAPIEGMIPLAPPQEGALMPAGEPAREPAPAPSEPVVAPAPAPSEPAPMLQEPTALTPEAFSSAVILSLRSFGQRR